MAKPSGILHSVIRAGLLHIVVSGTLTILVLQCCAVTWTELGVANVCIRRLFQCRPSCLKNASGLVPRPHLAFLRPLFGGDIS